ncbi:MAG: hypothetical protein KC415_14365, partial [Anaerolineales bacterium]|nr:hypothetical protein [Anaerolineales bacterium]
KNEWKPGKTEEQVLYSARKRAIGAFKQQWWDLPADGQAKIGQALEDQFAFLFEQLNIYGTREFAQNVVPQVEIHHHRPTEAAEMAAEEDVSDLAD